jgi:hypothetical protein
VTSYYNKNVTIVGMNKISKNTNQIIIAKTLLWIATVAALGAAFSAISNVDQASAATKVVETWRMVGFVTFAALFALLAWRPFSDRMLWLIIILNKAALSTAGIFFALQGGIKGVDDVLIYDGGLTILLVIAFFLSHLPQRQKTV